MAKIEVLLPQLGEGVIEATITRWLLELKQQVEEDEPLVEIATDKVDSEIPSPATGILIKQFFTEGEIPRVGDVIAIIETNSEADSDEEYEDSNHKAASVVIDEEEVTPKIVEQETVIDTTKSEKTIITPFIRHYAGQRGIGYEDLKKISGSGENGTITKQDILDYFKIEKVVNGVQSTQPSEINKTVFQEQHEGKNEEQIYVPKEGEEVVKIDRTRKLIAGYMVKSIQTAPHVTSTVEADVTHIVQWREKIKADFKSKNGANLTYTPVIVEQVVKALKEFPEINVSLYGDTLVKKKYINIGIATALPNGNLIVPVIRNADHKNLTSLAIEISAQSNRARTGKLKPGDTTGGTFTITNLGQFNNIMGTPIINQPESAILAVGAIKKRAWVIEENGTMGIGVRDVLTLSLSYDHRIIDGALGGAFLNYIGQLLEKSTPIV